MWCACQAARVLLFLLLLLLLLMLLTEMPAGWPWAEKCCAPTSKAPN